MNILKIKRKLKNISLKTKFTLIIFLGTAIITLCFLFGFQLYSKSYNELLYKAVAGNLSFSSNTVSSNLMDLERMSDMLIANPSIQGSLSLVYDSDDASAISDATNSISRELRTYYDNFKQNGICYITLINKRFASSTNYALYHGEDGKTLSESIADAQHAGGAAVWTISAAKNAPLLLSRQVRKIEHLDLTPIGMLVVTVDMDRLIQKTTLPFQNFEESYYILYDKEQPIYVSDDIPDELLAKIPVCSDNSYEIIKCGRNSYFIVTSSIPGYKWMYVTLVPFNSIASSLNITIIMVTLIILLGLIITLQLSRLILDSIIIHFNSLLLKMNQLSDNEYSIEQSTYDYNEQNDEIGQLHQKFDWMANRINTLVNTNLRNTILTREAQIKALESQINPHFLYNSLESINWRAKAQNNKEISQIAESLGLLFRETLRNKESLVTLEYELQLVNSYVTIQKIRYEERLIYHEKVDKKLYSLMLPPLIIQPLLENAIRYGLEENTEPSQIFVMVEQIDGDARICVMNEGSTFDDDLLKKLRAREKTPHGFGIGLLNIDQRIKLLFGDDYGLLLSNQNDFAVATIHIPLSIGENSIC